LLPLSRIPFEPQWLGLLPGPVAKILATGFIRRELGTLATRVHLASLGEAMDAPDHAQ